MIIFKRNNSSTGIIFFLLLVLGFVYKTESGISHPINNTIEAFSPIDTAYAGSGDGAGDGAGTGCGGASSGCDGAGTGAGDGAAYTGGGYTPIPPDPTVQVNFN
jgi:hypothetical protein